MNKYKTSSRPRWLTCLLTALLIAALAPQRSASAEPCHSSNAHKCPEEESFQFSFSPADTNAEDALPIEVMWGATATEGLLAAPQGCSFHSTRLTTDAPAGSKGIILVYIVPSDGIDRGIDRPKVCPDGRILASPLHNTWYNGAVFTSKEYLATTGASKRFKNRLKTYTHITTTRDLTYAAFLRDTGQSSTSWNWFTPTEKLTRVRNLLMNNGFDDPNHIYFAILEAKQMGDDTVIGVGGKGQFNTALSTGCASGTCYAYGLRTLYNGADTDGQPYYDAKYGCSNRSGDLILLHEESHVLGAVPSSAPNYDTMHPLHVTTTEDALYWSPARFLTKNDASIWARYDPGVADYRSTLLGRGWDTAGYGSASTFRTC